MIFKPSSLRKAFLYLVQGPKFYGAPKPADIPTTTTTNQNSIPAELMPYVKNMLNRAEPLTQQAYKPYSTNAADYVAPFSPLQKQAQTSAAKLQTPGQFAPASQMAGMSGLGSMMAGQNYQNQATDPNAVGAYMSPYIQNVMQQQGREINRNYDITGAQQQGQATQAGAFGGSREALMAAENDRNRNMALNKMQAEGLQNAYQQANTNQQFGSTLGLQGMGQGVQAAGQLGQLGTQQLAAETGVMNTQNTIGGQQQAQQQQAINQSVLNYQNAQQYPYMQLGFMSDLLRGTPTGNTTQTQYQAQPGMASQIGGLAATGLGAYAAMKADGGVIKDQGYKSGGIVGYKDRGYVEESMLSKLEDLDKPHLQGIIQKNESPEMTGLAKEVYATKLATGGIVAFANNEEEVKDKEKKNPLLKRHEKMSELQSEVAPVANKTDMGIGTAPIELEQAEPVVTPVATPVVTPVQPAGIPLPQRAVVPEIELEQAEPVVTPVATPVATPVQLAGIPLPQRAVVPEVASDELDALTAQNQKTYDEAKKEADIPIEDRIQQRKDLEERFLGKDTGNEDYRADLAKQKADAPDELRQMMGMRLMEFGANWASTPGAPLVAGMKALREALPSVMKDTKEHKAMMKDLDKSTYMLEHSIRLDAMGQIDAAAAEREKAAAKLMKHGETVTTLAVDKYRLNQEAKEAADRNATSVQVANIGLEGHRISAAGSRRDTSQITGSTMALIKQKSHEDAVNEAKYNDENMIPFTNKDGKEVSRGVWIDTKESELSQRYLTNEAPEIPKNEMGVEQPKPQMQAPPTVGEVRDGYKYNGGAYNSESSWSKV